MEKNKSNGYLLTLKVEQIWESNNTIKSKVLLERTFMVDPFELVSGIKFLHSLFEKVRHRIIIESADDDYLLLTNNNK